jgi:hypothetical protein
MEITKEDENRAAIAALLSKYIPHPFIEVEEGDSPIIMALVQSEGQRYLGGIRGLEEDFGFILLYPLRVVEGLIADPAGNISPQVRLDPMSFALDIMENFNVRAGSYYLLTSSSRNQAMVLQYKRVYDSMFAERAGLVAPTMNDISNISKGTFGNGPRS